LPEYTIKVCFGTLKMENFDNGPAIMDIIAVESLACSGCGTSNPTHLSLEHGLLVCGDACFDKCLAGNALEFDAEAAPQMQVMHTNSEQTQAVILVGLRRPRFLRRKTLAEKDAEKKRRAELDEQRHQRKVAEQNRKLEDERRRTARAQRRTAEEEKRRSDAKAEAEAAERAKEKAAKQAALEAAALTPDADIVSVQALLKRDGIVLPQLTLAALEGVSDLLALQSEAEAQLLEDALVALSRIGFKLADRGTQERYETDLDQMHFELFDYVDNVLQKKMSKYGLDDFVGTIDAAVREFVNTLPVSPLGQILGTNEFIGRQLLNERYETMRAEIIKDWTQLLANYARAIWGGTPRGFESSLPLEEALAEKLALYTSEGRQEAVRKVPLLTTKYFATLRNVLSAVLTSAFGKPVVIAAGGGGKSIEYEFANFTRQFLEKNELLAKRLSTATRELAAYLAVLWNLSSTPPRSEASVDSLETGDNIGPHFGGGGRGFHGGGGGRFHSGGGGFRPAGGGGFHRGGGGAYLPPHRYGGGGFFPHRPRYSGWGHSGWRGPRFSAAWLLPALYWSVLLTAPYRTYPMYATNQWEMEQELFRLRRENASLYRENLELYADPENRRYVWAEKRM